MSPGSGGVRRVKELNTVYINEQVPVVNNWGILEIVCRTDFMFLPRSKKAVILIHQFVPHWLRPAPRQHFGLCLCVWVPLRPNKALGPRA